MSEQKILKIALLVALVGALLMVICIFLPYATASENYTQELLENSEKLIHENIDMTEGDMVDISMFEYAKVYGGLSKELFGNDAEGIFYVALVALIGVFAVLALFLALGKKPIGVMIFGLLSFAVFSMQNWDYEERGIVPSSRYGWGIGHHLFYVGAVIVLAGAIWMLVEKIKIKKAAKLAQQNIE